MTDIRITDDTVFEHLERELAERLEHGRFDEPRTVALEAALLVWRVQRRDRLESAYPPETAVTPAAPAARHGLDSALEDSLPASDPPQQVLPERIGAPVGRQATGTRRNRRLRHIPRAEVEDRLENDGPVALIDLAEPDRYAAGHLPGAANLPLDGGFETAVLGTLPTTDRPVVVYGADDRDDRPAEAAARLAAAGFREVLVYGGGTADWRRAGLPLDRGG